MKKNYVLISSFISLASVALVSKGLERLLLPSNAGSIGPVAKTKTIEIKKEVYRAPAMPEKPVAEQTVAAAIAATPNPVEVFAAPDVKETPVKVYNNVDEIKAELAKFAVARAQEEIKKIADHKNDVVTVSQAAAVVRFQQVEKKVEIEAETIQAPAVETAQSVAESKVEVEALDGIEITVGEKIQLQPIVVKTIQNTDLVALYNPIGTVAEEVAVSVSEVLAAEKAIAKNNTVDRISTAQAAPEKSDTKSAKKEVKSEPKVESKEVEASSVVEEIDLSAVNKAEMNLPQSKPVVQPTAAPVVAQPEAKPVVEDKPVTKNDELVFFDYSASDSKAAPTELTKQEAMQALLKSEMKKAPKVAKAEPTKKQENSDMKSSGFVDEYSCSTEGEAQKGPFDYSFEVMKISGANKFSKVTSFEFDFKDDINERVNSDAQGKVYLRGTTAHTNVRKYSVYSRDSYPTSADQEIKIGTGKVKVPVFATSYFNQLMVQNKLQGLGGHVLVELDAITEDVEVDLDIQYEKKLYMNKAFAVVDRADSEYDYIMFIGIRPGNTIVNFKTYNNEVTSKIIHVSSDEIFYEPNYYVEQKKDGFKLCEEHVLSKNILPLDLDVKRINQFSQNAKVMKRAMGEFYYPRTLYPTSTRKYLELTHLRESIFVGYQDNTTVVVPSENYISAVMEKFGLPDLKNQCIVQVNLSSKVRNLSMEGVSYRGPMKLDNLMLDEDGVFYEEFTSETKRVFVHGEEQGIINLKLEYNDGAVAYIQSYCSSNTYLVEQL